MNYYEALAYLQSLADVEQAVAFEAPRFDLGRVFALMTVLSNPQRQFRTIHVVGTKGKGSTAAMIEAMLRAAGFRAALYSSPHLHSFRERMRVGGESITPEALGAVTAQVREAVADVQRSRPETGKLTTFEVATAAAMLWFQRERAEVAVIEAGLGGRLDATNTIEPSVTVITAIGLDHTQYLGDTVDAIAREKAAVIRRGVPVVSAAQRSEAMAVIEDNARAADAPIAVVGRDWHWRADGADSIEVFSPQRRYEGVVVPLLGTHQRANATLAVAAVDALRDRGVAIPDGAIGDGIAAVRWPGRLEILDRHPLLVVDGAHNPDSMRVLREALAEVFGDRRLILVLGCSVDKDLSGIVAEIAPAAGHVVLTRSRHARATPPGELAGMVAKHGVPVSVASDVSSAIAAARLLAGDDDLICVTGSLFLVAEARESAGVVSAEEME